jgi:hypothetical protein
MREIITVVGEAFIVICGVAVGHFFTGGTVVDHDPAFRTKASPDQPDRRKTWYVVCYMLALIVLVTLVLRFLIGSRVQLMQEYGEQVDQRHFFKFVTDFCFLMFYGAFLVAVAQSKSVRAFMGWLAVISGAGVLWSLIALARGDRDLPYWWLAVNSIQFTLTGGLSLWCLPLSASPEVGRKRAIWGLVMAGVWFMIIFAFDLEKIILKKVTL